MSALISMNESTSHVPHKECEPGQHVCEFLNTGTSVISCLRNDEISVCLRCSEPYENIIASTFSKSNEDEYQKDVPINHFHIYRRDGICGSKLCFPDMLDPDTGRITNYGLRDTGFCKISNSKRECNMKREDDVIIENICRHEFEFLKEFEDSYEFDCVSNCIFCKGEFNSTRKRETKAFFRIKPRDSLRHDEPVYHAHVWKEDGTCREPLFYISDVLGRNYGYNIDLESGYKVLNENSKCNEKRVL